jgi:hypothetical protein
MDTLRTDISPYAPAVAGVLIAIAAAVYAAGHSVSL